MDLAANTNSPDPVRILDVGTMTCHYIHTLPTEWGGVCWSISAARYSGVPLHKALCTSTSSLYLMQPV